MSSSTNPEVRSIRLQRQFLFLKLSQGLLTVIVKMLYHRFESEVVVREHPLSLVHGVKISSEAVKVDLLLPWDDHSFQLIQEL